MGKGERARRGARRRRGAPRSGAAPAGSLSRRGGRVGRKSNYDKTPFTPVRPGLLLRGRLDLASSSGSRACGRARAACSSWSATRVSTSTACARRSTEGLRPTLVVDARQAFKDPAEIERLCAPYLGDDPVFGRLNGLTMADFLEPGRRAVLRGRVDAAREGLVLVFGPAAALVAASRTCSSTRTSRAGRSSSGSAGTRRRASASTTRASGRRSSTSAASSSTGARPTASSARCFDRIDWLLDTNDRARRG